MNFKKRVNGSWTDTPHYIHNTSTDTITALPAVLYPTGTTATVGLKGQTLQSSVPTPDNPVTPQGTGERTGNLFDKNGEVLTGNGAYINIISTGIKTIIQTAGSNRYSTIKLDNELLGKTITISSTITQSANNKGQIRLFYVNGRYTTSIIASITTAGVTGHISGTLTMPSSIPSGSDGIAIVLSSDRDGDGDVGDYVEYADLMIVEGSTAPSSYIPYGYKIPISSANTTTPIYLRGVETTRKIKKLVLTGEENWSGSARFRIGLSGQIGAIAPICTHYRGVATASYGDLADGTVTVNGGFNLTLAINDQVNQTSLAAWKSYLATQYAAGTPVTVWYVLATPETAVINEPLMKIGDYADTLSNVSIPVTAGGDTISVDTTVQPSEVTVNYKGWHPMQSVHERSNGQWN